MNLKSLVLITFFGLQTVHCGPQSQTATASAANGSSTLQHYTAKLDWQSPLAARTAVSARLTFLGSAGAPAQSVSGIKFTPWMPSMGHGTSTADQRITAVAGTSHEFLVTGIFFSMGGDWEIQLAATVDGQSDSATIAVSVP
ncbi:MAG: hypothetical protein FJ146_10350 [Deltaproteobacteria bacterium]|nr:hypothetical protein [Deltaproteobacteria bacterium]